MKKETDEEQTEEEKEYKLTRGNARREKKIDKILVWNTFVFFLYFYTHAQTHTHTRARACAQSNDLQNAEKERKKETVQ